MRRYHFNAGLPLLQMRPKHHDNINNVNKSQRKIGDNQMFYKIWVLQETVIQYKGRKHKGKSLLTKQNQGSSLLSLQQQFSLTVSSAHKERHALLACISSQGFPSQWTTVKDWKIISVEVPFKASGDQNMNTLIMEQCVKYEFIH